MYRWIDSIVLICFLFFVQLLAGIAFMDGSGQDISWSADRDFHFRYHNQSDDLHFYGASKWAVRFNFAEVYPTYPNTLFEIRKALLFFPQIGDSVKVELFTDSMGQPQTKLREVSAVISQNHLEVTFAQPVQIDKVWLIISYSTMFNGPFVSASSGGGTRSYYLNTNVTIPYYHSMANAGFQCEFLFGLAGDFILDGFDLQLRSFDLKGAMLPNRDVHPEFRIYNHSSLPADQAQIQVNLSNFNQSYTHSQTFQIPSIPPFSEYSAAVNDPNYNLTSIPLPANPSQIRLEAILSSEHTQVDTPHNNTIIRYLNIFADNMPNLLVENFLLQGGAAFIWHAQSTLIPASFSPVEYFPHIGDSLGVIGAAQRFNWYSLNTLPVTIINGQKPIYGYTADYAFKLTNRINETLSAKTFVSDHECRFNANPQGETIQATITLTNSNTTLYTSMGDFNLITSSRFFAGLFRRVNILGTTRFVFERWVEFAGILDGSLTMGESMIRNYTITLNNLPLDEFVHDYVLFYWIQRNSSKEILFSAMNDFSDIVAVDDVPAHPGMDLMVFPNPLFSGHRLYVEQKTSYPVISNRVDIYNIRGQLILSIRDQENALHNNGLYIANNHFNTSGIYLIRVRSEMPDHTIKETYRKLTVIQ